MDHDRDRDTIGLTAETQAILADLEARGWFLEGQDAARFCLAYAVRSRVAEGATAGTETRWAAGNFDRTGEIRAVIAALYPDCKTPVRLMEHLVNEGLKMVSVRVRTEEIGPAELMD
ncbi:hypothetical protein HL667_06890 [Bradyrhizobium sp. 83012]|uniref:Uncharacterized protein n=1 Tax=Bradyrhizobium aeschynomenes TaxID=2734909 RepID=A0ABX2CB62_9BRAD|nr:hypothetical protein [Bradyrhizobium aeschynomenes]NPU64715.1 hypothetical protein [Bradyrhizobium aeschynomenes]